MRRNVILCLLAVIFLGIKTEAARVVRVGVFRPLEENWQFNGIDFSFGKFEVDANYDGADSSAIAVDINIPWMPQWSNPILTPDSFAMCRANTDHFLLGFDLDNENDVIPDSVKIILHTHTTHWTAAPWSSFGYSVFVDDSYTITSAQDTLSPPHASSSPLDLTVSFYMPASAFKYSEIVGGDQSDHGFTFILYGNAIGEWDGIDRDGVPSVVDNCPSISNPDQADSNSNGEGDACDPVDVADDRPPHPLPATIELFQNYPNPFNPSTVIEFSIPKPTTVAITIYNAIGELVRTVLNQQMTVGNYRTEWDGHNDNGESVSSGVYFYQLNAGDTKYSRKMMLLR